MAEVVQKRRFTREDRNNAAEVIYQEYYDRKERRREAGFEPAWDEVDRQLAMEPDVPYKFDERGAIMPGMEWMPDMELPLQTQTLEVLTADARRFLFPDTGPWFSARCFVDKDYLEKTDFRSLMLNKQADPPSENKQFLTDIMIRDFLEFFHKQYRFRDTWDMMNSGAFSHGTMVGRARFITKHVNLHEAKGVVAQSIKIPQLIPLDIRHVYLDDSLHNQMREGSTMGPSTIIEWWQKLEDLILSAKRSTDPDDMWFPDQIADLVADDNGQVHVLEQEGDLIIPRKSSRSFYIANAVVTVAYGNNPPRVIRIRFNELDSTSYISAPYQSQNPRSPYGVSPLMKGMPIQKAASEALNRLMMWAALNTQPPIKHGPDPYFDQMGGPVVAPMEQWPTMADVEAVEIGDGQGLLNLYTHLLSQYYQVTGTQATRLGAPAKSHTTARAAERSIEQAQLRTVDYDRAVLQGPIEQWLSIEYGMIRRLLTNDQMNDTWRFYSETFGSWMLLPKGLLPLQASFEVFGSAGPFEQRQREGQKMQGLQMALQVEQARRAMGMQPRFDMDGFLDHVIRVSGNTDIDEFLLPTANAGPQLVAGPGTQSPAPGGAPAPALAAIPGGGAGG